MRSLKWWQKGCFFILVCLLFLFPINSAATSDHAKYLQSTVIFTPQITPVDITATLEPTIPTNLRQTPVATPIPHPQSTVKPVGTISPELENVGGTEEYGYKYLKGSEPPTWLIFWGDEQFLFSPDTAAEAALLDEFRNEIENYADQIEIINNELDDLELKHQGLGFEVIGLIGGSIAAVFGCAGTPFTFWLAGGSGWACAGGIVAAIGSIGAGALTIREISEAKNNIAEAQKKAIEAFEDAEGLFQDLERQNED